MKKLRFVPGNSSKKKPFTAMVRRCVAVVLALAGAAVADEHQTLRHLFETIASDVAPTQVRRPQVPSMMLRTAAYA
jgi:hypothetical protein